MRTPWHIRWLKLEQGPWRDTKGAGVKVALLDSGVAAIRAMPEPRVRRLTHEGKDSDPIDRSLNGHGTGVAGVAASQGSKVPGIAPEAEYLALDVYGVAGTPVDYRAASALDKVAELGVDLVCCTFTLPRLQADMRAALARLAEAKIPVLVAAGNRKRQASEFPEQAEGLITVAALDQKERVLRNSRYGNWTTIAVPGRRIQTWKVSGRLDYQFTGTSAAAPMLAGVVALVLARARELGGEAGCDAVKAKLAQLLVETAVDRGPVPKLDVDGLYAAATNLAMEQRTS